MRILTVGPLWRGSNAGGLFRALSRQNALIQIIDEFYYISLKTKTKGTKILERALRPLQIQEFNNTIKNEITNFQPSVLLIYKGAFVLPETLQFARANNCKLTMFYPDVSMTFHGKNIPDCIPLYDLIFTTKTFGIQDLAAAYGVKGAIFIPHGFDPDIHRPLNITNEEMAKFGCDASFIGTYSPKKETMLTALKDAMPEIDLKIWGDQWNKATSASLKSSIMGRPVMGDLYATAIQCSKINLAILSEKVSGASSGDLITSRTFHITGASGFMLHERNEESVLYYKENEEAGFFDGPEEMVQMVKTYLNDEPLRTKIKMAGHNRALKEHSLDARAKVILSQIKML
jgi:spore maturation protein CgeB